MSYKPQFYICESVTYETNIAMITKDKVTEIFYIIDEFDKNLDGELKRNLHLPNQDGNRKRYRNRKGRLSESEVMTILICYHFGTYRNFKEYYQNCIRGCFHKEFPHAVSYNRFVELMPRVFCKMMLFMKLYAFGKCTGITFVDSTMIPVCHNVRRYFNKVFSGLAKNGKGTMGWCHGFKLHLLCNDSGEVITFCLTGANVDDRDSRVWNVFTKVLYGKVFADRGYIKQESSKKSSSPSIKASRARRSFFVGRPVPRARSTNPLIRFISNNSYWLESVTFS